MTRFLHTLLFSSMVFTMWNASLYAQLSGDTSSRADQGGPDRERVEVYIRMAQKHRNSSLEKSLEYANQALDESILLHDTSMMIRCYEEIGQTYFEVEMFPEARQNFTLSRQLSQETQFLPGLKNSFEALGKLLYELDDTVSSLGFFWESLAIAKLIGDLNILGESHLNIANVYAECQIYDSALVHYNNSLDLFVQSQDTFHVVYTLQKLGEILQILNDHETSRKLLLRAQKLALQNDMRSEMAHIAYKVALSLRETSNPAVARDHLEIALDMSLKEGEHELAADVYKRLAEFTLGTGDYETSLDYRKRAFEFEDSLRRMDQKNNLKFLEMKYDYEMRKNELDLLRLNADIQTARLERQKRIGFFTAMTLIIFFLALVISIRIFLQRRKIVKSLEEKQKQLEKSHRELLISEQNLKNLNDTKNKLFSILAHDLINPFKALMDYADNLNESSQSLQKESIIEYSKVIYQTAQNLYQLLENLLQWSRSQTGKIIAKKETIHLNSLVDNVISLVQATAHKKNIHIQTRLISLDDMVADPDLVAAALRNLVQNAIKFTPKNKTITVSTRQEQNNRIIEVIDDGLGISEENQKKLFRTDMHYTTNGTANEKGAGLGLLIAKEFVEINGGKLKVTSKKGKGSIFTIEFPA